MSCSVVLTCCCVWRVTVCAASTFFVPNAVVVYDSDKVCVPHTRRDHITPSMLAQSHVTSRFICSLSHATTGARVYCVQRPFRPCCMRQGDIPSTPRPHPSQRKMLSVHDTHHTSRITRHASHVTHHTSRITRHASHVAHHTSRTPQTIQSIIAADQNLRT